MQRRTLETLLASLDVAALSGRALTVGGNQPVLLDHPDTSVLVLEGHVDVFAVPMEADGGDAQRQPLFRAASGEVVFGPGVDAAYKFLVIGIENTRILMDADFSDSARFDPQHLAAILDRYVIALMKCVTPLRPDTAAIVLDRQSRAEIFRKMPVFGIGRQATWIRAQGGSDLHFLGNPEHSASMLPVSSTVWIEAADTVQVETFSSRELVDSSNWRQAVTAFTTIFGLRLAEALADLNEDTVKRQLVRQSDEARVLSHALEGMAHAVRGDHHTRSASAQVSDPLHAAFLLVAQDLGVEAAKEPKRLFHRGSQTSLGTLAQTYKVRTRKVMLRGRWWRRDAGPLLAYLAESGEPVALVCAGPAAYDIVDPKDGTKRRCTQAISDLLSPEAVMLYRPLPEELRSLAGLIAFILPCIKGDLRMVGVMGLAGGLLTALTPVLTSVMIEEVLPRADVEQHIHILLGLIAAAFGGASFTVVKAFALLRVEGRADLHLQASIFDRLLRLPAGFFRRFTVGDLVDRTLGIQTIRQMLSGATIQSLLGAAFACFSLALLVYYNWKLSLVALLLVVVAIAVTIVLGRYQLREERTRIAHQGLAEGFVLQLLTGLAKLRISAAEGRAYAKWAGYFTKQKQRFVKSQSYANWLDIFHAAYPVLATAIIFAAASKLLEMQATDVQLEAMAGTVSEDLSAPMSTGDFVAFNTAFGQFLAAMTALATALTRSLAVIPMFERLKPVIEEPPEQSETNRVAETLRGGIELSHVSFRYDPAGPLVLDDVSIAIEASEFVAIVGPSGSGKSTLVRLLLGFETCESGDIYFDQTPISSLDLSALRQQVRVVMQHGQLVTGSVFWNIVGSSTRTLDDAWAAARQAGLAEDIESFPMGMHTVLMEGVNTISGGQRQRLMMARALVHRPSILLLDEPTSALDNNTQAVVMDSISHLSATRVVIAHRLSTVRAADRIIVMDKGRVVEQGTYDQLMSNDGPFADMAKRQLV